MANVIWRFVARTIDGTKRRVKHSPLIRHVPLIRYSYLFEYPKVILIPELELAFIPTPKVANRSMKSALASHLGMRVAGDIHHADWQFAPLAALRGGDYYCAGFVRNPLDRLLSCYAQKIVLYERQMGMPPLLWRYGDTFHKDMSFADFVHAVAGIPDRIADIHFRSQYTFFYHRGELLADFVGRFERLTEDWGQLQARYGLPALPHHNPSRHADWREAYTPELAAVAARRYAQDIELFDYRDEIAALLRTPATG